MQQSYLEVTFRHGKPLAAYYYLPRRAHQTAHRTERIEAGLVVDYAENGQPIGIEITAPSQLSLERINKLLKRLGQESITQDDLSPLRAA